MTFWIPGSGSPVAWTKPAPAETAPAETAPKVDSVGTDANPGRQPPAPPAPPRLPAELAARIGPVNPAPRDDATTGEIFGAAWDAGTLQTNAVGLDLQRDEARERRELLAEIAERAGISQADAAVGGIDPAFPLEPRTPGGPSIDARLERRALARARALAAADPARMGGLPTDEKSFEAEIRRRREARLAEAEAVLAAGRPGAASALTEFAGGTARAMADPVNIGLAFLGAGPGAGVLRTLGLEAVLGATGEALALPEMYAQAEKLDRPDPNAALQIGMGAAGGAAFAGGIMAAHRGLTYALGRRSAAAAEAPPGADPTELDDMTNAAEAALRAGMGVPPRSPAATPGTTPPGGVPPAAASGRPPAGGQAGASLGGGAPAVDGARASALTNAVTRPPMPGVTPAAQSALAALEGVTGPLNVISAARDAGHNARVGGASGSQHLHGNAFDVDVSGMSIPERQELIRQARAAGFTGIGVYDNSLHFDVAGDRAWGPSFSRDTLPAWAADAVGAPVGARPGAMPDTSGDLGPLVDRIIGAESGGNASAANASSSARGAGQILSGTWLELIRRHRPDLARHRTDAEILAMRGDYDLSRELTTRYAEDGRALLAENGLPTDAGALYLHHFLGPGGVQKALRAEPGAPVSSFLPPAVLEANANVKYGAKYFENFTQADLRRWAEVKIGAAADPGGGYRPATRGGYTQTGQVVTPGGTRFDVDYEIVDASSLIAATGALQPRDRSRAASAEQIAGIAGTLDPARLMPSPETDRGAPIVGPDSVIESGNGRVQAIVMAAEQFPDRYAAYVSAIGEAFGGIPEGVTRPVLIGRRTTEMDDATRQAAVRESNTSAIARMAPGEQAASDAAGIDDYTLSLYQRGAALDHPDNRAFSAAVLGRMTQAERAGMITKEGRLNSDGVRRMRAALFARAYDAPDLTRSLSELEGGDTRILLEALAEAAPAWARLRAAIDAGDIRPELDASAQMLEAVRVIGRARETARAEGVPVRTALAEAMAQTDMLGGGVDPLTAAFVGIMYRDGRARAQAEVSALLAGYAEKAMDVGGTEAKLFSDMPDPTPREVLDAIRRDDPDAGRLEEGGEPDRPPAPVPPGVAGDGAGADGGAPGTAGPGIDGPRPRADEDGAAGPAERASEGSAPEPPGGDLDARPEGLGSTAGSGGAGRGDPAERGTRGAEGEGQGRGEGGGEGQAQELIPADFTTSPEFREWFAQSRVVDEAGAPRPVYHGTASGDFETFDPYGGNYGLMGSGSYFTEARAIAGEYVEKGAKGLERRGQTPNPTVYTAFVSIQRPLDMDAPADLAAWRRAFPDWIDPDEFSRAVTNEDAYRVIEEAITYERLPRYEGAEIMQDGLRGMGFDGVTHIGGGRVNKDGPPHRVWIAFEPEQIKVASREAAPRQAAPRPDPGASAPARAAEPDPPAAAIAAPPPRVDVAGADDAAFAAGASSPAADRASLAAMQDMRAAIAEAGDFDVPDGNGGKVSAAELLDDLAEDVEFAEVVAVCARGGGAV